MIKKCNCSGISTPLEKNDWKIFKKIMQQLLLIFCMLKKKNIYIYISCLSFKKHNSDYEKQIIFLMISNKSIRVAKSKGRPRWHYLAVQKLSALLREVTSKHRGDFYCLNYFHSFATETNLNRIKKHGI